MIHAGDLVDDGFEVAAEAGAGSMGTVFRALDRTTGGPVALKVLHGADPAWVDRFFREAALLARLSHPALVGYVGHGATPAGARWIAMEWLEGESLDARLSGAGLEVQGAIVAVARAAAALGFAHARGIVHRDVKPSNLFLVGGEPTRMKVLDFGIARLSGAAHRLTQTVALLGTPGYMAPEQARGERDVGPAADVFALGCVLFECLAGRPAYSGGHPLGVLAQIVLDDPPRLADVRDDLPAPLTDLVLRMMSRDPAGRPTNGDEAAEALTGLGGFEGAAPARAVPTAALGDSERRVVSVVLAATVALRPDIAATLAPSEVDSLLDPVRAAAGAHGARAEMLVDGSIVAMVRGTGTAVELAVRAARTALAMKRVLPHARLALATGRAVVTGAVPVGEVIDRAISLIAGAPHGVVRMDPTTALLVEERFDVLREGDAFVLGVEREAADEVRMFLGRPAACVGRDRELALLLGTWDDCVSEGAPKAVLVTGSAGVGKSRLRDETISRLRDRGDSFLLLVGRGDEIRAGSAFGLIAPALRHAAGIVPGEPAEAMQARIRARLGALLPDGDRERVVEFLGELVGVPFPDEDRVQLRAARRDRVLLGDQIRAAWEDWLAAQCAQHPVLLVLEDLHWGDLPTVQLVDGALRALEGASFMVLAVGREDVRERFPDLWTSRDVLEIRLSRLSRAASEKLVRSALGDTVDVATVGRIIEQSDGNAFFLEEIVRAVSQGQTGALPDTVLGMIQARLDGLDPDARRVLRAASVFGRTFWQGGVAALLGGRSSTWVGERLDDLANAEVIVRNSASAFPGETEWTFRHVLVRECAYQALTDSDRTLGHRLAAQWLERAGERDAVVLAEHSERGGSPERAATFYLRAAADALKGNDLAGAIARAEHGVRCLGAQADSESVGALRLVQAEASRWSGALADAEGAALEAVERFPVSTARWYDALGELLVASGRLGRRDNVAGWAEALRTSPAGAPDARIARASALCLAAWQLSSGAVSDQGPVLLAAAEEAVAALPGDEPLLRAQLLRARSSGLVGAGDLGHAVALYDQAASEFDRAGDTRSACVQRGNEGYALLLLGRYEDAQRALHGALAASERMGLSYIAAFVRQNLGLALAMLGRLAEGRSMEEKSVAWFRARGDVMFHGGSRSYLATILQLAGDLARAEEEAREAVAIMASVPRYLTTALATLSCILLARGDVAGALVAARRAVDSFESRSDEREALAFLALAEALDASGRPAEATAVARSAHARLIARADRIKDAPSRDSFLTKVPENAKLAARAGAG